MVAGLLYYNMNAITYCRVSTQDQSNDSQEADVLAYCKSQGITVAGSFRDVMTGGRSDRPGITSAEGACLAGGIDAIITTKLDRVGRSLCNVVQLIARLDAMGVGLICIHQGVDTRNSNPCGRFAYQILAAAAEFERALIRERVSSGVAHARSQGIHFGRPLKHIVPGWRDIMDAWKANRTTYRDLALRLGGIGVASAHRLAKGNTLKPTTI